MAECERGRLEHLGTGSRLSPGGTLQELERCDRVGLLRQCEYLHDRPGELGRIECFLDLRQPGQPLFHRRGRRVAEQREIQVAAFESLVPRRLERFVQGGVPADRCGSEVALERPERSSQKAAAVEAVLGSEPDERVLPPVLALIRVRRRTPVPLLRVPDHRGSQNGAGVHLEQVPDIVEQRRLCGKPVVDRVDLPHVAIDLKPRHHADHVRRVVRTVDEAGLHGVAKQRPEPPELLAEDAPREGLDEPAAAGLEHPTCGREVRRVVERKPELLDHLARSCRAEPRQEAARRLPGFPPRQR